MSSRPRILGTLDGFAIEGGLDEPRCPSTCFNAASQLGTCASTRPAPGLWGEYEKVLDVVGELGLNGVRLTVEWARVEPRPDEVALAALHRYREVVDYAASLGLTVTVVLVDAAWPSWLGPEAWLLPWVAPRVVQHAERVVDALGENAAQFVAFARREELIRGGFLYGTTPPWRRGAADDAHRARRQIAAISESLEASPTVGPRLLTSYRELPVGTSAEALRLLVRDAHDVAEIHLRSLVRGAGPTAGTAGLITHHQGQWQAVASDALREAWLLA